MTNAWDWKPTQIVKQYAKRWLVEKGISEQIHFFHRNKTASSIVVKVDFDLTLTAAAHNIYRTMALSLEGYERETSKSLNSKYMANGGSFIHDVENPSCIFDVSANGKARFSVGLSTILRSSG